MECQTNNRSRTVLDEIAVFLHHFFVTFSNSLFILMQNSEGFALFPAVVHATTIANSVSICLNLAVTNKSGSKMLLIGLFSFAITFKLEQVGVFYDFRYCCGRIFTFDLVKILY
jgi:hypothetical protein